MIFICERFVLLQWQFAIGMWVEEIEDGQGIGIFWKIKRIRLCAVFNAAYMLYYFSFGKSIFFFSRIGDSVACGKPGCFRLFAGAANKAK